MILLAGALTLAGGVERSLENELAPFRIEGGEFATVLALGGVRGMTPALRWTDAPLEARHFVVVGDDLDALRGSRVFWIDGANLGTPRFEAPGLESALEHRLRVRVFALAEPLVLPPDPTPEQMAGEASRRALATATWLVGGGWLR